MKFKESAVAHRYLDSLKGIEIGGAAHNPFGLNTINIDRIHHTDPQFKPYAEEQMRLCGEVLPVDIVAPGDDLPFPDKWYDFVISSHVIEHFYDPIAALKEWRRVARKYIFIICPHRDALPSDVHKPLTSLEDIKWRHSLPKEQRLFTDEHHSRWTLDSFVKMCDFYGLQVVEAHTDDDKVGNGFMVIIDIAPNSPF
jgi:SAM-dependent methyltransferase